MNGFDLSTISNCYIGGAQSSAIYIGNTLIWPTIPHDYSQDYFTIESLSNNNDINWEITLYDESIIPPDISISYSRDLITWYTSSGATDSGVTLATLNVGEKLYLKNTSQGYHDPGFKWSYHINTTNNYKVYGNIMSLLYGDNFINQLSLANSNNYTFASFFRNNEYLLDASHLILPATTLVVACYQTMFYNCTSLTAVPELPATTIDSLCYRGMFNSCTSLTTAPELPATTLAARCYENMFQYCTSLTAAPELPATTLAMYCYSDMFYGCTSLTASPELPATTLVGACYQGMFANCTSLNYIKCLATDISADYCLSGWTLDVAQTGIFVRNESMHDWSDGIDGIPTGWTITPHDYYRDYFTIESLVNNNTIKLKSSSGSFSKTLYYSTDLVNWTSVSSTSTNNGTTMTTLNAGGKLYLKGNNTALAASSGHTRIWASNNINVYGNINSLINGDNYQDYTSVTLDSYTFVQLFSETPVVDASNLVLPYTYLPQYCYDYMFNYATRLVNPPKEIPAATYNSYSCRYMFRECHSMVCSPIINNGTVANNASNICSNMFSGCTSLTEITCLFDTYNSGWFNNWVSNVSASGTFVRNESMHDWVDGVNGIPTGWTITTHDYYRDYFTIEALDNNISLRLKDIDGAYSRTVSVSTDGTTWTSITSTQTNDGALMATLNAGEKLYIKGSNTNYASSTSQGTCITSTGNYKVYGNIMSLIYGDNFVGNITLSTSYAFANLFRDSTNLIDVSNLILPATKLTTYCYYQMFYGCTSLTTAPKLIATKLTNSCYRGMFENCIVLTTAPQMNITSIASYSCNNMFKNCTSLTNVTVSLPSSVNSYCYYGMFEGCTSLTAAPALPATTLTTGCYRQMFKGCTSLTTAPELPATKLEVQSYLQMFYGCTHLNYVKCLATDISANSCTSNWLTNTSNIGNFYKNASMTSWSTGADGIPTGWTVQEAS